MIKAYIKEYSIWYLLYLFITVTYHTMFFLYHLPHLYFLLSFVISLFIVFLITVVNYTTFSKKMKLIKNATTLDNLPNPQMPSEQAYDQVLRRLVRKEEEVVLKYQYEEENLERLIKQWTHQMKVPIAAISLMIQTDHLSKSELKGQLFSLEKELNMLLSFFKYKMHADDYRFVEFSLKDCLKKVIKKFSIQCISKNIRINLSGDGNLVSDQKWLSFVIEQIIDNAIKYSLPNSVIKIEIKKESIVIQDNGIGILEEDIPRLFEQGFTGFNGHENQKATGLGLYMSKQILDQLGLSIKVKSQVNKGTTVCLGKKTDYFT